MFTDFPGFTKMGQNVYILVTNPFFMSKLVSTSTKSLAKHHKTILILPYTFLGCHGFLMTSNQVNLTKEHLNHNLEFVCLKSIQK
jgi:hypothetical protein